MEQRSSVVLVSVGLALGGVLGLAGTFAPTSSLRGLAWGIDGLALVMATCMLAIMEFRQGRDMIAAGFLVFAIGQGLVVSGSAMDLDASAPGFGAGCGLWSVGLALVSVPRRFHLVVRLLGLIAAGLMAATAVMIFSRADLNPVSSPLPFFAYPFLVATLFGWIWSINARRVG